MKNLVVMTLAALCWTGCSTAGPAPAVPIAPGKGFSLKSGEFGQTADASLRVGFERVTADSRCPKGEQCVWAGDASARIWLQTGTGPREFHELHTATGDAQAASAAGQVVQLLRLDPYPLTGKTLAPGDYLLILMLGPAPAGEPKR